MHAALRAAWPQLRGLPTTALALCCLLGVALPGAAAAQAAQAGRAATENAVSQAPVQPLGQRVLLLRLGGSVRSPLAPRVEPALARALSEHGFLVTASPLPFQDAQLVAGCTGALRDCGSQVAQVLDSEHLAVALLEHEESDPGAGLRLFVFESSGAVRDGFARLPHASDEPLEPSMRDLIQRVLGAAPGAATGASPPAPSRAAAPPASTPATEAKYTFADPPNRTERARRARILPVVGWTTLGVGGSLLVAALGTSIAAQRADQAYAERKVLSREDADRALAHYQTAQHRTEAARVLWGVGAGTAAAGAFLLLWQHFAGSADRNLQSDMSHMSDRRVLRWGVTPARSGVSLALSGEL
jgi:hypothetical protein